MYSRAGKSFMILHEHLAEGNRRAGDILREGLSRLGGGGGASRSLMSGRRRKKATMAARKYRASLARSRVGKDAKEVGVEPDNVSCRCISDRGGTLDLAAGSLVAEALDHAVDEAADLTEEVAVVEELDAQRLGEVSAVARPSRKTIWRWGS